MVSRIFDVEKWWWRGMHESRIWGPGGVHIASSWQDGLVRRAENEKGEKQRILWFENMERTGKVQSRKGKKKIMNLVPD